MNDSDGDVVIEQPQLTKEQVERGCRVADGKIVCQNEPSATPSIKDGTTNIQLGDQHITGVRCIENRKSGKLECTVNSRSKK